MKTIAQQIKWDFKTNGDLEIQDKNGNLIYWENSSGYWVKREWDSKGNRIYFETSKDGIIEDNRSTESFQMEFGESMNEILKAI